MKPIKSKNKETKHKTLGQKMVEEAEARMREAHKRGVAIFCSSGTTTFLKTKS